MDTCHCVDITIELPSHRGGGGQQEGGRRSSSDPLDERGPEDRFDVLPFCLEMPVLPSDCGYKETEDEGQPDAQQTCTR